MKIHKEAEILIVNRKLAEWLEPSVTLPKAIAGPSPFKAWVAFGSFGGGVVAPWTAWTPADFYADETNALLERAVVTDIGWPEWARRVQEQFTQMPFGDADLLNEAKVRAALAYVEEGVK